MPVDVFRERYLSRSAREALYTGSCQTNWIAIGTDDDNELREYLAPRVLDLDDLGQHAGKLFQDYELEPIAELIWGVDLNYGTKEREDDGASEYEFDTTGGTVHITQSRSTIASYKLGGGTAPNFGGAIGVTPDGIEGADIIAPAFAFSETHYVPSAAVDDAFKALLFVLTGCVNNATFGPYAPGECIFLGARGSRRGRSNWQLNLAFAASPNVTGLTVGGITGIDKAGWDYLWILYRDAVSENILAKKPVAAYVERVQRFADLNDLYTW